MAESEEELKSLLMKVKVESEQVGLMLNIQKTMMASGPITSWETVETVSDFIFLETRAAVLGSCFPPIPWEHPPAGRPRQSSGWGEGGGGLSPTERPFPTCPDPDLSCAPCILPVGIAPSLWEHTLSTPRKQVTPRAAEALRWLLPRVHLQPGEGGGQEL